MPMDRRTHSRIEVDIDMLKGLKDISVAAKTYLICMIFMSGMICIGATSWVLLNGVEHEMIEIAEEDVPLIRALTKVTINSLEQAILVEKILPTHDDLGEAKILHDDFDSRAAKNGIAFAEALALTDRAEELAATPEALRKLQQVGEEIAVMQEAYQGYVQKAQNIFDKVEAGEQISIAERDEIEAIQKEIDHWVEEELLKIEEFAEQAALRAEAHGANVLWSILVVSVIASIVGGVVSLLLVRAVATPLRTMASSITDLAKGNHVELPCLGNGDELGVLARSLDKVLQKGLEATRLRQALDRCNTMVMVSNNRNEIVYVNPALRDHLKKHEVAIRVDLPKFSAEALMGGNIDIFRDSNAHRLGIGENAEASKQANVKIGGRRLIADINPVINDTGTFLGTVVEWADKTEDLTMRDSIDQLIGAVRSGDFDQRIELKDVGNDHRNVAEGMNAFAEVVDGATREMSKILAALAEGDLTQRIETSYQGRFGELKDSANRTADQLSNIVAEIQDSAGELKNAAAEITSGTEDLSNRTEQAAADLQRTASSTEQMSATVRQNAENAKNASELAGGADQSAKTGGEVVEQAVSAMAGIEESAQKITDIISVIDEIAFQTNLLALNASVEAARAGEAGKGFAVVAQEVRQLAQRSAQAADDIKTLIQNSNGQVKDGVRLVNRAGEGLTEIVGSIGKVASIVQEISNASQEQASGVQEINSSIASMDEMTQQNSALVEESTASAHILGDQASKLAEIMAFFKLAGTATPASLKQRPKTVAKAPAEKPLVTANDDEGWSEF